MNEVTLASRHRIQNSNPGGLRSRSLPLGQGGPRNIESSRAETHFYFFET